MNTIFGAFAPTGFCGSIRENPYPRGWPQACSNGRSEAVPSSGLAFSVFLREETAEGWVEHPSAQTRLVPHDLEPLGWALPERDSSALTLEGELLRFVFPNQNDAFCTRLRKQRPPPPGKVGIAITFESHITAACDLGHIPSHRARLDCAVVAVWASKPRRNKSCV